MRWTLLAVVLGFLLDLCFGDPRWLYHPVRIIGKGITFLEKSCGTYFRKQKQESGSPEDSWWWESWRLRLLFRG